MGIETTAVSLQSHACITAPRLPQAAIDTLTYFRIIAAQRDAPQVMSYLVYTGCAW